MRFISVQKSFRSVILILLLVTTNCKDKSKTDIEIIPQTEDHTESDTKSGINKSVSEMWHSFVKSNPQFRDETIPESDFFHNNKEDADRLAELTLKGKKKASSGLYSIYKQYKADLPKVGTKQIVTDFEGTAKAIIENTSVDTIPFNKISKDYAELDMGTSIEPLKKWKKAHWEFFETFLKDNGQNPTEDMLIVCVKFERIWPED